MSIYKRKHKSGSQYRFDVTYKDCHGERKRKSSKWYSTKTEAKNAEREFLLHCSEPQAQQTALKVLIDMWLDECENIKRNAWNTMESKRHFAKQLRAWEDRPISAITAMEIKRWFEQPEIARKSTGTKNQYRMRFHQLFDVAVRYYGMDKNPADMLPPFQPSEEEEKKQHTIYTPEQFAQLVSAMPEDDYRLLIQYLYWLGLRLEEGIGLQFADFMQDDIVHIQKQWDEHSQSRVKLKTKTSDRYLRVPEHLMEIFRQQREKYRACPGFTDEWYVFGGYHPLNPSCMYKRKNRAIEQEGLPYITCHELRHSYVSILLAQENNPFLVARSAGHAKPDITMQTYGHIVGNISDFADNLNRIYLDSLPNPQA